MSESLDERFDRLENLLREILDVLRHPAPRSAPLDFVELTSWELPEVWGETVNPADGEMLPTLIGPKILQVRLREDGGAVVCATWGHRPLYCLPHRLEVYYTWAGDGALVSRSFRKLVNGKQQDTGELRESGQSPELWKLLDWVVGQKLER